MAGRNTFGNRRARRPRPLAANARINSLRKDLTGTKINLRGDPTSIVRVPWNTAILQFEAPAEAEVDLPVGVLRDALSQQLFLPPALHYEIKMSEVKVWGPASTDTTINDPTIIAVADLSDLSEGALEPLAVISDVGNLANRACCGYKWPMAQKQQVINTATAAEVNVLELSNTRIVYITILWKPRATGTLKERYSPYHLKPKIGLPDISSLSLRE